MNCPISRILMKSSIPVKEFIYRPLSFFFWHGAKLREIWRRGKRKAQSGKQKNFDLDLGVEDSILFTNL